MTVAERVALAKTQIKEDAASGELDPAAITSYRDLHDFVDANAYGFTEAEWNSDAPLSIDEMRASNEVQNQIDAWIKEGGLR